MALGFKRTLKKQCGMKGFGCPVPGRKKMMPSVFLEHIIVNSSFLGYNAGEDIVNTILLDIGPKKHCKLIKVFLAT